MGRRSLHRHSGAVAETVSALGMAADDAAGNYWGICASAARAHTVAAQTAPTLSSVAVILLTPKATGLFRIDADVGWSDNTNADSVVWRVRWKQVTVAGQVWTVGGTTPVAAGIGGLSAGGGASGFVQTAASGLTINAPAGGGSVSTALDQKQFDTLTGLLANSDQYYGFNAITGTNTDVPFAIGRQVSFAIEVTATDNITIPSLQFTVQEIPWQ